MMGIKYFTEEEIEYLSSNIYVESVNEKQITYTIEFKQFFVREYMNRERSYFDFLKVLDYISEYWVLSV